MQETQEIKVSYFFDEAGSPEILGHHGINLMQNAINKAIKKFQEKWGKENESNIRVFIQQSSERPLLQATDYVLWTVQRAYERGEFRFYEFLKDKIKLVHDIFDFRKYNSNASNYYSSKNPLEAKKIDPV